MSETNLTEAIAAITAKLPAIGKDQKADPRQGGYAYRGIEDITKVLQPLLAEHGVVFLPQVMGYEVREILVNDKPWTDTILTVAYQLRHSSGDVAEVRVVGIGRDNSDKGANKAMTQAFKYAILQVFCISDPKDDADKGSPAGGKRTKEEPRTREAPTLNGHATEHQLAAMGTLFTELGITDRAQRLTMVSHAVGRDVASSKDLDKVEASAVIDVLEREKASRERGEGT